jgi:hypothetical protein
MSATLMLNEKQPPLAEIFNFTIHFMDDRVDDPLQDLLV